MLTVSLHIFKVLILVPFDNSYLRLLLQLFELLLFERERKIILIEQYLHLVRHDEGL